MGSGPCRPSRKVVFSPGTLCSPAAAREIWTPVAQPRSCPPSPVINGSIARVDTSRLPKNIRAHVASSCPRRWAGAASPGRPATSPDRLGPPQYQHDPRARLARPLALPRQSVLPAGLPRRLKAALKSGRRRRDNKIACAHLVIPITNIHPLHRIPSAPIEEKSFRPIPFGPTTHAHAAPLFRLP